MIQTIEGVYEISEKIFSDTRGSFMNLFRSKENEYSKVWGSRDIAQINISKNKIKGTIRGLHYQKSPFNEAKLIRCIKGKVWDIIVDLRINSKTYAKWKYFELCADKGNSILIPEGCAHGFQTLEDDSELFYIHSKCWAPKSEIGIRWNDPTLMIDWPIPATALSERDQNLPYLEHIKSNFS